MAELTSKDFESIQREMSDALGMIQELTDQVTRATQRRDALQKELETMQRDRAQLRHENSALQEQFQEKSKQCEQAQTKRAYLERELQHATEKILLIETQLLQSEGSDEALENDLKTTRASYEESRQETKRLTRELQEFKERVSARNPAMDKMREDLQQALADRDQALGQVSLLESDLTIAQNESSSMKAGFKATESAMDDIRSIKKEQGERIALLEAQRQRDLDQIRDLEHELQSLRIRSEGLEGDLRLFRESFRQVRTALGQARHQFDHSIDFIDEDSPLQVIEEGDTTIVHLSESAESLETEPEETPFPDSVEATESSADAPLVE